MANKIPAGTMIRRSQDLLASEMDGEYLIMSIEEGTYIALLDVAARIWELLEKPCPVESLFETLLNEYAVDLKTCKSEVSVFLRQMAKDRLILMDVPK